MIGEGFRIERLIELEIEEARLFVSQTTDNFRNKLHNLTYELTVEDVTPLFKGG